jgi:PRTRC genetic system protein B
MNGLTERLGELYMPHSALLIYKNNEKENTNVYVEAYDIGRYGNPINAHPLTVKESCELAKLLDVSEELSRSYLKPVGLLPKNVLFINPERNGFAIWHTPPQKTTLFFQGGLTLQDGEYQIPALVWKANKNTLWVFAVMGDELPELDTPLYDAPFFNIYQDGKVCMGTVDIDINENSSLETFMAQWHEYFFRSKFSHLIGNQSPVKGNIIQLFQSLTGGKRKFPQKVLIKNHYTIQKLLK